jgi:serine/threonine protein kinase
MMNLELTTRMKHSTQQQQIMLPKGVTIRGPTGERYVIEGLLGKEGIGSIYLVRDRRVKDNLFALKEVINPDKRDRERFVFEGKVLKRLDHRALPRVYRVFEHNKLKRVYMLMDYVEGKNLETLRKEQPERRFSLPLALTLMAPIVDALVYLHKQAPPIVHRDIKPANIIVPIKAEEAMLVDFGSAKEYVGDKTTFISRRSPGYAAPEQYGSGTTPRTDIYGLGATFYTLLTGAVPVDAISRVMKRKGKGVDPLKPANLLESTIPTAVAQALQRAMSISSADRFESIEEFWQVLNAYTTEQQVQIPRVTSADTPQPLPDAPRSRKRAILIPIYLTLLLTIALAMGFLSHTWWFTALLLCCIGGLLLALLLLLRRR